MLTIECTAVYKQNRLRYLRLDWELSYIILHLLPVFVIFMLRGLPIDFYPYVYYEVKG